MSRIGGGGGGGRRIKNTYRNKLFFTSNVMSTLSININNNVYNIAFKNCELSKWVLISPVTFIEFIWDISFYFAIMILNLKNHCSSHEKL